MGERGKIRWKKEHVERQSLIKDDILIIPQGTVDDKLRIYPNHCRQPTL